jgi:multidrug resistance efflux pump
MQANRVRWMVAGLAAVGVLAAGGTVWLLAGGKPAAPAAARTVERVSSDSVTAKGTVEPIATQSLSFSVSGTVTAVTVQPGDMVVAGQVLARIDPADARQDVADAQVSVDDAQAVLDAAWASASASPSPAASCSSPSPSPTLSSSAASPSNTGRASAVAAGGRTCTPTTSTGNSGSQRGGPDSIFSAQQQVNNDNAALARAQRQLAGTVLKAPVSGKVLSVTIKVGDEARSNVMIIGVVSTMVVRASFSEADVVSLAIGESAGVVLPGRDETFTAKITQIAETGTISDNLVTYDVILTFDRVPDGILVGQSANVTVAA